MKKKLIIALCAAVFLVSGALSVYLYNRPGGRVVEINGKMRKLADVSPGWFKHRAVSLLAAACAIVGPDGDILEEFSNGQNSGWMFTVNGIHSGQGLNSIYVTDGDEIVWHYVDDYVRETMDNYSGTNGSTSTWNTWLDADDGLSINAGALVAVAGAQTILENTTYTATLPYGSELPTAEQISVIPEDTAASVSALQTSDGGMNWTFTVTAENGTAIDYSLQVVIAEQTANP